MPTWESEEVSVGMSRVSAGNVITTRVMAIISQMMIVTAILLIAHRHFDNTFLGIAAATLLFIVALYGTLDR